MESSLAKELVKNNEAIIGTTLYNLKYIIAFAHGMQQPLRSTRTQLRYYLKNLHNIL